MFISTTDLDKLVEKLEMAKSSAETCRKNRESRKTKGNIEDVAALKKYRDMI